MAGTTLGISIEIPIMTSIGNYYGWRTNFIDLVLFIIAIIRFIALSSIPEKKLILICPFKYTGSFNCAMLTLLGVVAHYSIYTYIKSLADEIQLAGGGEVVLLSIKAKRIPLRLGSKEVLSDYKKISVVF